MTASTAPAPRTGIGRGLLALLWRGPLALVASGLLAGVLTLLAGASLPAALAPVAVTVVSAAGIAATDPTVVAWVRGRLGWYAPRHAVHGRYSPRHLAATRRLEVAR